MVILPEGPNVYVNVKGKIWKVANEHVRAGTSEEMQGVEAVHQVFQDLQGRFGPDRRGVLDHSGSTTSC